jgi:hypothetical protein
MRIKFGYSTKLEEIPEIAKEIANLNGVKAIYLFGSHAKNKTHPLSDIDICVINFDKEESLSEKLNEYSSDNLDISLFSKLPLNIQIRVLREGKALIVKDEEYIKKLKFITLRRYLDFKPAIDRFCKETLNV